MATKYLCPSCQQPMVLDKHFGTKPRGKKGTVYRLRRFVCKLCGISEMIAGTNPKY